MAVTLNMAQWRLVLFIAFHVTNLINSLDGLIMSGNGGSFSMGNGDPPIHMQGAGTQNNFGVPSGLPSGVALPRFLSRSHTYRLVVGDTVVLPCEVQNLGSYVLVWRKGTTLISAGNVMVTLESRYRLLGNSLQIHDVDVKDAGDYVCQIGDGQVGDQIHTIEILVPPSVIMSPTASHVTAKKAGSVTFECKATGNPSPRIEWSKKGGYLPTGEHTVMGFALTITNIERKDAGTYQCTASNGVGQPSTATISLHVLYPPEVSTDKTWVNSLDGIEAQLSCVVHADPPADIQWYQDSFHLEPTDRRTMEMHGNAHILTVRNVQTSDFGNYSCLVENSLGRTKKYIELTGRPGPVHFLSHPTARWPHMYNVTWRIDSLLPIQEVRLLFRKLSINETYQQPGKWHDIILSPITTNTLNQEMSYVIRDLEPSSVYEVMVQAKNKYGWSELSELYQFYTRGYGDLPNEIEDLSLTAAGTTLMPSYGVQKYSDGGWMFVAGGRGEFTGRKLTRKRISASPSFATKKNKIDWCEF